MDPHAAPFGGLPIQLDPQTLDILSQLIAMKLNTSAPTYTPKINGVHELYWDSVNSKLYLYTYSLSSGWVATLLGGLGFSGANVYHNTTQSVSNGATLKVAFNSENFDTDSFHDPATNNSRLTIPTTGKYLIVAGIAWASAVPDTTICTMDLRKNNVTVLTEHIAPKGTAAGIMSQVINSIQSLTAGDYLEIEATHTDGSPRNLQGGQDLCYFHITKLG